MGDPYQRAPPSGDLYRAPSSGDMHRGAMIWPVNGGLVSPPPPPDGPDSADSPDSPDSEASVSEESHTGQYGIKQTKLDDKLLVSDEDDMWDSVLQESGMVRIVS